MKHILVTRCKFNDETLFQNYYRVMEQTYIPSLNKQKNKNFILGLVSNQHHFDLIRQKIDKNIEMIRFDDQKKDYREYVIKHNITLQTRHDCDDIMNENYIEVIQNLYEKNKNKYEKFILNFHPTKYDFHSKKEYTHSRDYSKVCSMFSTLIQKEVTDGVFDVVHDLLKRLGNNVIYIPETYVKLVIHNSNISSKLNPNDKII